MNTDRWRKPIKRRRASLRRFPLLLALFFLLTPAVAWADTRPPAPTSTTTKEIRRLYPNEWGVDYVEGVAYATALNHLYLINKAQPTMSTTTIVTISPLEEGIGQIEAPFPVDDVINLTFDNQGRRLLLLNNARQEIAQISLGGDQRLDGGSLVQSSIAAWRLEQVAGMAIDARGETLYLLDSKAEKVVRVSLAGGSLSNGVVSKVPIAHLGSGLRGLALHPRSGNLFIGDWHNQRLLELTPTGQLIQAHSLWSMALAAPGGFVFAPSADMTDAPETLHLFLSNSNLASVYATASNDQPNRPEHTVFLPLAGTPGTPVQVAKAAGLFGEVVEVALCKSGCSSGVWSFTRQVRNSADDAEERIPSGDMSEITSTDLELIREANTNQLVGIRFQQVAIPRGATIRYAAIEFEADEADGMATALVIYGEAASNAAPFSTSSYNISRRALTAAQVSWQEIDPWYWVDAQYHTPNLAPIVQEIVQRDNWKNGNALVFIIKGSGRRTAESYDGEPTAAARLYVEYSVAATTAPATVETTPVPNSGDAADDPAIWVHPTDPALSTILGTDKLGGLAVYDLQGRQLQYVTDHKVNNVDLRDGFPLGGQSITLVAGSSPADRSIALYRINPTTRLLEPVAARPLISALPLQAGACMYHSPHSGNYYVIINDETRGDVEQWELFDNGAGAVDAKLVRAFSVGYQTEGCVADDALGHLYIASEDVGIWKYGAEPDAGTEHTLIDSVGGGGRLTADVEGLTLYDAGNGDGYLLASSQGSNQYVIYERAGNNAYVTTFAIEASTTVDKVAHTDGIDVISTPLGSAFPFGLFVAQDDFNDGANQNFKLVPWEAIAYASWPSLRIAPIPQR
ncbi:MAG: hypothetical protein DYG89_28500 [Caldilinea sp. CFX5]|nr:hypothetical protein [Caldilinea sp. CFX5]